MVFQNITAKIAPAFSELNYHCDFVEINALARGQQGIDEDYTETLYPTKTTDELSNLFSLLESRADWYGNSYPFDVNASEMKISLKAHIEDIHKLYIFFLMCSCNTKIVREGNILESDFEHISTLVLKAYLPTHAQVHHFGKSSYTDDRYTGLLTNKLDTLAQDLKCQTAYVAEDFADSDTGDGGLDVVAWVPFPEDNLNFMNIQVYLGQCAIGKDWVGKQTDVEKMKNNIHFPLGTVSVMFVPHDLRKEDGHFKRNRIRTHLMFDRFRLMNLVDAETLAQMRNFSTFNQVISRLNFDDVDITEV
ncbi:conserved hypothetical protein [Vibrio harveyi]|uniref:hypothetical protein n=1 Tax=Vibrio harveyi TaxID=669 RepID=UPI002893F190|nr:conserved hypothetical protein [Vibrio harveyi]